MTNNQKQRLFFTFAYFVPAAVLITLAAWLFIFAQKLNFEELALQFGDSVMLENVYNPLLLDSIPGEAIMLFNEHESELSMAEIDNKLRENGFAPIFEDESSTPYYTLSQEDLLKIFDNTADSGEIENVPDDFNADDFFMIPDTLSLEEFTEVRENIITETVRVILLVWGLALILFAWLAHWLSGRVMRPLEDSLQKQKNFVSDAAHEFRTPLSLIKSDADILARDSNVSLKDYEEFRTRTVDTVSYLSALTTKLLQLTRLDRGEVVEMKKQNIGKITEGVVERFEERVSQKNIHLVRSIAENVHIKINKEDYEQLLMILMDNALKYTPNGGSVSVELVKKKNDISLRLSDTGPGIPKEKQKNIFDRFYCVDESRSENSHGLGLAIAWDIVQKSQGTISVSNANKGGAVFTVTLPHR